MIQAALDGIVQAVAAAILVIVFGLGDRIIDVDGRNFQLSIGDHLVESVHPRGGLFGNTVDTVQHFGVLFMQHPCEIAAVIQHHVGVPGLAIFKNGLLDAPLVFFLGLSFPGKNRNP